MNSSDHDELQGRRLEARHYDLNAQIDDDSRSAGVCSIELSQRKKRRLLAKEVLVKHQEKKARNNVI